MYAQPITLFNFKLLHPCTSDIQQPSSRLPQPYLSPPPGTYNIFKCIYIKCQCPQAISRCVYSIIIICILRCLHIFSSYPLPRYIFQNISECILLQTKFLVVQCPFWQSTSIGRQPEAIYSCEDIVIYIYAMIEAIKSQLESDNFIQSHVNMGTATIIMLVSQ